MSAFKKRVDAEQESIPTAVPHLRLVREPEPGEDMPAEPIADSTLETVPRAPDASQEGFERQNSVNRFGLRRGDQVFIAVFVVVALGLMLAYWFRLGRFGSQPVEIERLEKRAVSFVVDINEASWVEWAQLDGIGPALARRIVANREEYGPFESIDDIERVPGIGAKRLEQLRPWLSTGKPAN